MTNWFIKDRDSYSGVSLEMDGVKVGECVLGLSFNCSNFQGFKKLFSVLYESNIVRIVFHFACANILLYYN